MKANTLLLLFYFISNLIHGQEVIATQGDSYKNASILIDFTIGESIIETYATTTTQLTQGFHQTLGVAYPIVNNCSTTDLILQNEANKSTTYTASETILSTSLIKPDSIVNYIAGSSILLKSGFQAKTGSSFRALIIDCTPILNLHNLPSSLSLVNKLAPDNKINEKINFDISPNPTSDQTTINFSIPSQQLVKLGIYDASGMLLNVIDKGELKEGNYSEKLTSLKLKNGIYYITLYADQSIKTEPLIIIER